jgi:hypothetical protein
MAGLKLADFFVRVGFNSKEFDAGAKKTNAALGKMAGNFNGLAKIAKIAIGGKIASDMASMGQQMALLASKTGIEVGNLTSLSSAFTSAGSSASAFNNVVNKLNSGLMGLSMGDASIAGILGAMGISAYTAEGGIRTVDDIIPEIADWAKSQLDLGRDRREIQEYLARNLGFDTASANLLMGGSEAVAQEQLKALREGRTLSKEAAENLDRFNNKLKELWETLKYGFLDTFGQVAPIFEQTAEFFRKVAVGWKFIIDEVIGSFKNLIDFFIGEREKDKKEIGEYGYKVYTGAGHQNLPVAESIEADALLGKYYKEGLTDEEKSRLKSLIGDFESNYEASRIGVDPALYNEKTIENLFPDPAKSSDAALRWGTTINYDIKQTNEINGVEGAENLVDVIYDETLSAATSGAGQMARLANVGG